MLNGWKTVLFNALALTQIPGSPIELLPPKFSMPAMVIGNFVLRAMTSTPVFSSEPATPTPPTPPLVDGKATAPQETLPKAQPPGIKTK